MIKITGNCFHTTPIVQSIKLKTIGDGVMSKYQHFEPNKYKLDVKVAEVKSSFHCKYNINYHMIWIPKYRKPILKGKVVEVLDAIIKGKCQQYGWQCLALEIMPDHLHLFLSAKPKWNPAKIINLLKGNTSRQLRLVFPHLHYLGYQQHYKKFPSLWARGFYCGTAGHVSQEQVIRYILEQEHRSNFNYDIFHAPESVRDQKKIDEWM